MVVRDIVFDPGETVLWTGAPTRYRFFEPEDVFLVTLSIAWCAFFVTFVHFIGQSADKLSYIPIAVLVGFVAVGAGLYIEVIRPLYPYFALGGFFVFTGQFIGHFGNSTAYTLFECLAILAAMYIMVLRLFVRYIELKTSRYTVTNSRLVVAARIVGSWQTKSAYYADLMPPALTVGANGAGTITCKGRGKVVLDKGFLYYSREITIEPSFKLIDIDNARHVCEIITIAHRNRHNSTGPVV